MAKTEKHPRTEDDLRKLKDEARAKRAKGGIDAATWGVVEALAEVGLCIDFLRRRTPSRNERAAKTAGD